MATININGQSVAVDDSFLKLPPDQQNATVDEIAKSLKSAAPASDKYQQAAIDEAKSNPMIDQQAGYTRRLVHGATLGADTTLLAGAATPMEMIKHGTFDPREGYSYAKAREDRIMEEARKNTGALGTAAEVLGGAGTGAGLANGGITAARFLGQAPGFLQRAGASIVDGLGFGAVSGAMEGNGLKERGENALKGGIAGALTGAAIPAIGAVASPVVSQIRARMNPRGYAEGQVARGIQESGRTPDEISHDVIQASNDGQGAYTVADAIGNPGQRLLSTVTRAPGEGRTAAVEALDARQAGQGRRVANTLSEGFGNPQTAAQTEARMTAARDAAANTEYGAVRNGAGQVDVVPALNHIDRTIGTQPGQALPTPNDSIESVLSGFRQRLARVNPDDFEAVQRIRGEMADAAQNAAQNGYGNRSRLLRGAVGELDRAMENASGGYRQANANFAQRSRDIEAIDTGRTAATRGRTEDTIPEFQGLTPEGQQAYRAGYVDPLIAQTQGAAPGVNKARPLLNDAFQSEAGAIAPANDMMQRRLGREQTMFETRNAAMGGSKTVDNLNDHAAMSVDPHFVFQVLSGNFHGAARTAMSAGSNLLTGNTPQVRQEVANILLQRGGNMNPDTLRSMVDQTVARMQKVQQTVGMLTRAATGGVVSTRPGQNR